MVGVAGKVREDGSCYKTSFELRSEAGRELEERGIGGDKRLYGAIAVVGQLGHGLSVVGRGEGEMPPQAYLVPGAEDARGWSSAITSAWPRLVAQRRGVWPNISGFSGLTSFRPSSILTTRLSPFAAAQ